MGMGPRKSVSCSPGMKGACSEWVCLLSHHPSLSHRRVAMINKTNNYPVITDCRPAACRQRGGGGVGAGYNPESDGSSAHFGCWPRTGVQGMKTKDLSCQAGLPQSGRLDSVW